jgi:hypothetical protein
MTSPVWFLVLVSAAACGASSSPDVRNADAPPTGFTFETADGTLASIGWSGLFHNFKGASKTSFGVEVTHCDGDVCQFKGPVPPDAAVDPVEHRRCLVQTSKTCTADADCPVSQGMPTPCVYVYDPPVATSLSGGNGKIGACALTYIPLQGSGGAPTVQGTLNLRSSELDLSQLTVLLVLNAVGDGTFKGVCPVCVGDSSSNDGKKEGTCQPSPVPDSTTGAIDPGHPGDVKCDVNRYGDKTGYTYGYSMDCSPTLVAGGTPTPFGGSFSSSGFTLSITDQSPKCGADPTSKTSCFCGMCSNSTAACMSDAECGGGQCIGASAPGMPSPPSVPVAGNLCDGGVCNWDAAAGFGTCPSMKLGTAMANCYPSAAMGNKDGAGNKVSITAPGRADLVDNVYYANTASARCTPAGMSAPVNAQVGLPGLTFQKRNFRIIASHAEDSK